jgi:hypothetical protein
MALGKAFWISPDGRVMDVGVNHIAAVIRDPKTFKLTTSRIATIYTKHKEPIGHEGNAREEIITALLKKGWIRIREYPNKHWSVQFPSVSPKIKTFIRKWARYVLRRNIAEDPYMLVLLVGFSDGFSRRVELETLAKTAMFEVKGSGQWNLKWGPPPPES